MSYFVRATNEYKRNLDILDAYYNDMAKSLSAATGRDFQTCLEYVKRTTSEGGRLAFKDPRLKYVGRNKVGDREVRITTFLKYIQTIEKHGLIMAPSMTVYQNPNVERSLTSLYIAENVKSRKVAKKEMFAAKAAGDTALQAFKNNEQQTRKIKANALSGAHCSNSTILYLDTIHSSLTSMCRSATGYGNANNEKIISGNRHYWAPEIVTANISSIIHHVDMDKLQAVLDRYQMHIPSTDDVMDCIDYCSWWYWRNEQKRANIRRLVDGLNGVEKAAFLYVGDLHHIAKHNPTLMHEFLSQLSWSPSEPIDDPKPWVDELTEEMAALVSMICGEHMNGYAISAFDDFDANVQGLLGACAKNVTQVLDERRDFIQAILVTDAIPASLASLPSIVRRCAITSDTDSTIYTVQDWIRWHQDEVNFKSDSVNVGHAISFLASSSITHVLATMSANVGIREEQIHQYAMKSEFYFPAFSLTSRAKTYFAHVGAQEGQVYTEPETELKGSVLHGSNSPQYIVDDAHELIETILSTVEKDETIQIYPILQHVASLEHQIVNSIKAGETHYFKRGEVKPADSYKLDESKSPYFQHLLWENTFANKYGHMPQPPYATIKLTLTTETKAKLKAWLDAMEDTTLRDLVGNFLQQYGKTDLGMIQVPLMIAENNGVPKELVDAVDIRSIVSQLMEPHYVILESLGYYCMDDNQLRLVSDRYPPTD